MPTLQHLPISSGHCIGHSTCHHHISFTAHYIYNLLHTILSFMNSCIITRTLQHFLDQRNCIRSPLEQIDSNRRPASNVNSFHQQQLLWMASSSSLSSVVSDLVRASMGASVSNTVSDADLDRHIAELILREAKKKAERYGQQGIRAYISNNL